MVSSKNLPIREESSKRLLASLPYILLALFSAVVIYVRIRLLQVPLERDEGEYAYMGQLLLKGIPPYLHVYTMKLPGVGIAYALIMLLFGQTQTGIHIGLFIVNGICIYLVYLLAKRLLGKEAAIISCVSYAVLSLSQSVFGVFAHATHFVVLFALAGFILLLHSMDRGRTLPLCISGLCFGLAFTMKQHAALLIIFALVYLAQRSYADPASNKKTFFTGSALFLLGVIIPYALIAVWMWRAGTFTQFWFWTVQYAREYASGTTLVNGLIKLFFQTAVTMIPQFPLWFIAIAGCGLLLTKHGRSKDRFFIFGLLLFSILAICPGFHFREHYYIMLLPVTALLIGVAFESTASLPTVSQRGAFRQIVPLLLFAGAVTYGFLSESSYFFSLSPDKVSRAIYHANPFPEAVEIARYIRDHTTARDRIAVFGSEPEIYFYSDRLSATGYIYMYGLMENQPHAGRMQEEMIREITTVQPKYLITVNVATSWLVNPFSQRKILDWGKDYIKQAYEAVGVVEIADTGPAHYRWDAQAAGYSPVADSSLIIYRRKEGV